MLRKENLLAFSALWFLVAIAGGYAFGQFLSPELTVGKKGLLGWENTDSFFFNYKVFLLAFGFLMLASPIAHAFRRKMIPAGTEVGLIILMIVLGWLWIGPSLLSSTSESGFLGFNTTYRTNFDTGIFLLSFLILWGAYLFVRYLLQLIDQRQLGTRRGMIKLLLMAIGIAAVGCYFVGMHRSIFHSTKFWVFEEEVSLIDSVTAFFQSGERFLGVIIITFTLVFPMVKFIYMFWGLLAPPTPLSTRISKILSVLGKYSMLDVFVVALLILNLKFHSDILDMQVRSGAILFGISIILNMIVTSAVVLMGVDKGKPTVGL